MRLARLLQGAIVFLISCSPATPSGSLPAPNTTVPVEQREDQQILRVGSPGLFANPTPQAGGANTWNMTPLYDPITAMGPNFEVQPWLAEKWELSADGLTWTFTLRRDVKWADGTPLTAEDVAWNFSTMLDRRWPALALFGTTTGAKAVNEWTVEITTRQQDQTVPFGATSFYQLPKKYYEAQGVEGFTTKPIGSGPYELVEFRNADLARFKLRPTPHAFRKPQPSEIVIRAIPENSQAINGLRTGDLDIAPQRNFSAEQADQLKTAGLNITSFPVSIVSGIMGQGTNESRNTPLKDKRVRLAINYAVDREGMAKNIYRGYGLALGQTSFPGSPYFDPDVKAFPFDPKRAKELLAEAGYPNGFKMPYGVDFTASMVPPEIVLAIQGYLKDVGIEMTINQVEQSVYVDKAYGRNNQFMGDLFFGTSGDLIGFGPSRSFQGCGRPVGGGPNSTWYCNPEWDRLLDSAYSERDTKKRADLLKAANKVQREDVQGLHVMAVPVFIVQTGKLRGGKFEMAYWYTFDNLYKVR